MKVIPTQYQCDICGRTSIDKQSIEKCESQGKPEMLVKVGDKIWFKDCDDTPVAKEELEYATEVGSFELRKIWQRIALKYQNRLIELEVIRILQRGHGDPSYTLGQKGQPLCRWSWGYGGDHLYPVISNNKLMLKVLELYNCHAPNGKDEANARNDR